MKRLNKHILFGAGLVSVLALGTSCKKELDINTNPRYPTLDQGTPQVVFPVGVLATTAKVGGDLAIVGGMWSQFFTQAPLSQQYTNIDSYNLPNTDNFVNDSWDVMYSSGLKNYQFVIDKADSTGNWKYYLMGTVMKAYTAEVLVDLYDKIPYTQALTGLNNLTPAFDDGYTVYQKLLASIDTALGKDFTANTNPDVTAAQDPIFGGDIDSWIAFANTLKLKMYLRMTNAHPDVAQAGIQKMMNDGVTFLDQDAAFTNFSNGAGQENPLYEQNIKQLNTATNIAGSATFILWLQDNSDPRISYFFGGAGVTGVNQGDYRGTYASPPTLVETPTDPVEFISKAESYFLQAEADVRYNGGGNAKALYDQGVMAAFAATGEDASSFVGAGGVYEWGNEVEGGQTLTAMQQIARQKWASCAYGCHGIESFFESTRTGFPQKSTVYSTSSSYVPGQLVVAKNSVLTNNQMPKRMPYPYDETSRNSNAPQTVVPIGTAVWWGK